MSTHDPFSRFALWLKEAEAHEVGDATAACLATAGADGRPSARMVLIKAHGPAGFVFHTNLESRKGRDLAQNAQAALCFHWPTLRRQVRVEGPVGRIPDGEADAYFASRPHESQIGAWASRQSRPMASREALLARVAEVENRFAGGVVPRPSFWSGFRIIPRAVEFWQNRRSRLHERRLFRVVEGGWECESLYP